MFKALFISRIQSLIYSLFASRRTRGGAKEKMSPGKKLVFAALAIYVIGAFGAMFLGLFSQLARAFCGTAYEWLYFSFTALFALVLSIIGSVFMTQKQLFEAKDNDLLLSMPIPPSYIVATRLLMLLCVNLMYSMLVFVPATAAYVLHFGFSARLIVLFIAALLLPLLSMAVESLLGWLVALISTKIKRKNAASMILYLAFLAVYMWFFMGMQNNITALIANGTQIGDAIGKYLPPLYACGVAVADGDIGELIILALWCVVPFAVMWFAISKSFIKISTSSKTQDKKIYVRESLEVMSPRRALLKKELSRFFSIPMYVLNCGLGAIMALGLGVAALVKKEALVVALASGADIAAFLPFLPLALLAFCASTICISAPSISLEGKKFWIMKTSPVNTGDVFYAKIATNIIVGAPALAVAAVICGRAFSLTAAQILITALCAVLLQIFISVFGLLMNLNFPRFDWINEAMVVKQSTSVIITMFGGMAVAVLPIVGSFALVNSGSVGLGATGGLLVCLLFFAVVNAAAYGFLKTKGVKLYDELDG